MNRRQKPPHSMAFNEHEMNRMNSVNTQPELKSVQADPGPSDRCCLPEMGKVAKKRQPYTQKKLRLIRNRRSERGKATYASHCWNACHARKFNRARPLAYLDYIRQAPATSAVDRRLKRALQWQLKLKRQLKVELHCRQMRAVHSANAAAKINGKAGP